MSDFSAGQIFRSSYPFVQEESWPNTDTYSWRPGVRYKMSGPEGSVTFIVADGIGEVIYSVVDVHRPGKYPTRVFYTRGYVDPAGKTFGKSRLRMAIVPAFARMILGYRIPYDVAADAKEESLCQTCDGRGMIGGTAHTAIPEYDGEPCPDCAASMEVRS